MNINIIREKNKSIYINEVTDEAFKKYGRVLSGYDFGEIISYLNNETGIPEKGNIYIPSDKRLEESITAYKLKNEIFGELDIQIGYCNGKKSLLNGLEYHKSSEVNIAAEDIVLLLGLVTDIADFSYNSNKVEAFFISRGTAVEIFSTTLHFGPCRTVEAGFKVAIVLLKGTNLPLAIDNSKRGDNKLLYAKNKWLLVHSENKNLIEKGAFMGIRGENILVDF